MTEKENSKNLGILPLTVLKISQKTQNKLETTVTYKLRPENALDFYKVFKMDLLNIWHFLKIEIITQETAN